MVNKEYFEYLSKVQDKFGMDDFVIPNNKEELIKNLEKEVKI